MRNILSRQNDLSIASFWFYIAGAVFAVLAATVFEEHNAQMMITRLSVAAATILVSVTILVLGHRFHPIAAATLMALTGAVLLGLLVRIDVALQGATVGLLFVALLMYLVWFTPIPLARTLGFAWLAVYVVMMFVKFGSEAAPFVVTFAVTMVVLAELLHRLKKNLETISLTDPLTEVWNKRAVDRLLERAVARAYRKGERLSLMYIDLDGFKSINDQHGHREGDRVLRSYVDAMKRHTRVGDQLARLGGDEFLLIAPGATLEDATAMGGRLQQLVSEVTWSFGVAELGADDDPEALLSRADKAMLVAKQGRRERSELDTESK